jgi:hypothetical protein
LRTLSTRWLIPTGVTAWVGTLECVMARLLVAIGVVLI